MAWLMEILKIKQYGDCRDLTRRTLFDQMLRDKALNIAKNPKFDGDKKLLLVVLKMKIFQTKN